MIKNLINVLEKENLNNILVVIVRYFGGIKLGAGGLVRAYTKSLTENLKKIRLIELEKGFKIELTFNYNNEKNINYILNNSNIISKEYNDNIKYISIINNETLEKLQIYNPIILEEVLIEKEN